MAKKDTVIDEVEEIKSEPKKAPRKYAPDEYIICRSITFGELLCTGPKSRTLYRWSGYGDTTEVEFQDLQALRSAHSSYIFKPRFVIEDEELTEQWGKDLKDMYKNITDVDVEDIFKLPIAQFRSKIKNSPKGVKLAIKNIAGEKILNGSLDSLAKIKAIDELLGTDLRLYIK
jgi:hypothetical protein